MAEGTHRDITTIRVILVNPCQRTNQRPNTHSVLHYCHFTSFAGQSHYIHTHPMRRLHSAAFVTDEDAVVNWLVSFSGWLVHCYKTRFVVVVVVGLKHTQSHNEKNSLSSKKWRGFSHIHLKLGCKTSKVI